MALVLYGETTRVITNFLFFKPFFLYHYPRKKGCKSTIIFKPFKQLVKADDKFQNRYFTNRKKLSPFCKSTVYRSERTSTLLKRKTHKNTQKHTK